jgi:hypothetical protein
MDLHTDDGAPGQEKSRSLESNKMPGGSGSSSEFLQSEYLSFVFSSKHSCCSFSSWFVQGPN